jgi:RHS repeat-associated protein
VDAVSGEQVAGTEENEWSYYDALGRLDARVGIDQGVLDHRYVNLLTQYSVGERYRREFMNAAGTDDQPLPGNLTKHWSTYGARGLLAQTHAPMTGTWPLQSDVLHGEIVLNDHLGSPRLRLESQLQAVVDEEGEDPTDILDWVVAGWAYRNPMDDTPFGRELPLSAEAKTTPEGYTGKPLDLTFGLQAMNYGARFYDPRLGRWWQRDPLAESYWDSAPYVQSSNNTLRYVDVDGKWYIEATFTEDRNEVGMLRLYDQQGSLIGEWEALAKGQKNYSWKQFEGSTPTGRYLINGDRSDSKSSPWMKKDGDKDTRVFGPNKRLKFGDPISGDGVTAKLLGRTVDWFRIHGQGSEGEKLSATQGCIRMWNKDIAQLYERIMGLEKADGTERPQWIEVIEISPSPPVVPTLPGDPEFIGPYNQQ